MNGIIALDGGGSKTEVVLVSEKGDLYYRDITSCSNPNDIGIDRCVEVISSSVKKAIKKSCELRINVECIMLAIAGVEFGNTIEVLKDKLQSTLNVNNIVVTGDLASVIELHLSDKKNGVVIISGTGFNMAFKQDNEVFTVGGWGYIPDDYLSGFDLGKDALVAASRAIDKVGEPTILVNMLEEYYNNKLWYAMDQIYKGGIKEVASLSRLVIKGYAKNDAVCKKIVDGRIKRLAKVIKEKVNNETRDIFLCGGIFENNEIVVTKLNEYLADTYHLHITNDKTIYGAARLAIRNIKHSVDEEFLINFDRSYKEVVK